MKRKYILAMAVGLIVFYAGLAVWIVLTPANPGAFAATSPLPLRTLEPITSIVSTPTLKISTPPLSLEISRTAPFSPVTSLTVVTTLTTVPKTIDTVITGITKPPISEIYDPPVTRFPITEITPLPFPKTFIPIPLPDSSKPDTGTAAPGPTSGGAVDPGSSGGGFVPANPAPVEPQPENSNPTQAVPQPPAPGGSVTVTVTQSIPGIPATSTSTVTSTLAIVSGQTKEPETKPPAVPKGADFVVTGLSLSSRRVGPGEPVSIVATVMNVGDQAGIYTAELIVNGQVESSKTLRSMEANSRDVVQFEVIKDTPASYKVQIGSETAAISVSKGLNWVKLGLVIFAGVVGLALVFGIIRWATS